MSYIESSSASNEDAEENKKINLKPDDRDERAPPVRDSSARPRNRRLVPPFHLASCFVPLTAIAVGPGISIHLTPTDRGRIRSCGRYESLYVRGMLDDPSHPVPPTPREPHSSSSIRRAPSSCYTLRGTGMPSAMRASAPSAFALHPPRLLTRRTTYRRAPP